ncbi:MAG TPA: patatin-like phospholipase family protein [Candidatus Acidoferrales bacterium]|nr:patatin-like phospholipase family protein [Candidatus Acidoferrales bacterium]
MTALVLSAGGLWAAWEIGAWRVLRERFHPDLIVGASAGAFNGLAIAGGASPADLEREWLDSSMASVMRDRPKQMYEKARLLCDRYPPTSPFALTTVEVPSLRCHIVRGDELSWRHLAASASIPCVFPAVEIDGRRYVDGGFRAGLPLWAAEKLGVTYAVALNVLNTPLFRTLQATLWSKRPGKGLQVTRIEPSERLGSLYDALVWNPKNILRWIALGERDALAAMSSVRM